MRSGEPGKPPTEDYPAYRRMGRKVTNQTSQRAATERIRRLPATLRVTPHTPRPHAPTPPIAPRHRKAMAHRREGGANKAASHRRIAGQSRLFVRATEFGSCTHTREEDFPWLRIELDVEYRRTPIHRIILYNRDDCCCESSRVVNCA